MSQLLSVSVAVEGTAFHFDKAYSYIWPFERDPRVGLRVMVPFGGGNRCRQAIVLRVLFDEKNQKMKCVKEILDENPLFTEEMVELAAWMKERYFCTYFDALKAMLPPGLMMRTKPVYRLLSIPDFSLTSDEQLVVDLLSAVPEGMEKNSLLKSLGLMDDNILLEKLVKKGILQVSIEASRVAGDATTKMVRIVDEVEENVKLTDKQERVLDLIREVGMGSVKEICYFASVTSSVILTLEKKGLVEVFEQEMLRSPVSLSTQDMPPLHSTYLNEEQTKAFEGLNILAQTDEAKAALLFGVTGSGKTQVYMNLMDTVLEKGKQVLVLVPEISLTPQMLNLFIRRYGNRVAVIHSGLSIGERMDEWKRIRRGEASIVIGTRSAVFAPLDRLGLVVFDEEQEHTYKAETTPRYHARDIAKFRCVKHKAMLVLASATPSVESYYYALSGRYSMFTIGNRYGQAALPIVQIANMCEDDSEYAVGDVLKLEMDRCIEEGKQIILLLNRRGYNTFVSCRECGHVITCPSCSISMTYHSSNSQLVCHYCGKMIPAMNICPECGSNKIRYAGLGTQKVEKELECMFPNVNILRMDADTTMSRFSYEEKFSAFARGEYQIMIGTQMVAKGLDFPNVGLVGILSADQSLYADDYRCYETSFDLFTQVIGRAGRKSEDSVAVIQTYTPENPIIEYAGLQDYPTFYEQEIASRKLMQYPPYTDLCQFVFTGIDASSVKKAAYCCVDMLKKATEKEYSDIPLIVFEPMPTIVARVSGKYRYKFLIKMKNTARTRELISKILIHFGKQTEIKNVSAFADINPASML